MRFVSQLGAGVLEWLAPVAGERVLDLGCGDGALTERLALLGCEVLGVDASEDMVSACRTLGLRAEVSSGEELSFDEEFDAVFSNAALHWMTRPPKVIDGVWRALKPGGRFVAEFGGAHNIKAVVDALGEALARRGVDPQACNPWYFPTPNEYRGLLETRGFVVSRMELFERPTPLPGPLQDWLETFAQSFTKALPAPERSVFLREVSQSLKPVLYTEQDGWVVDYVRLRFAAERPLRAHSDNQ